MVRICAQRYPSHPCLRVFILTVWVVLILLRCASFVEGAKNRRMKFFFQIVRTSVFKNITSFVSLTESDQEFSYLKEIQNTSKRFTGYQVS